MIPERTRHWVTAYIEGDQMLLEMRCEHPEDCQETGKEGRALGCSVKAFFDEEPGDLFNFPRGERWTFGTIEVGVTWRGFDGEDGPDLIPAIAREQIPLNIDEKSAHA